MYKPSEFIACVSPMPMITGENLSDVIEKLNVNVRCKILLLGTIRHLMTNGRIQRLTIVTENQLKQIQKAWPVIIINGEDYRFVNDGNFLGLQRVSRELLVFKKQKVKVFDVIRSLLKVGPIVAPQLAH